MLTCASRDGVLVIRRAAVSLFQSIATFSSGIFGLWSLVCLVLRRAASLDPFHFTVLLYLTRHLHPNARLPDIRWVFYSRDLCMSSETQALLEARLGRLHIKGIVVSLLFPQPTPLTP